MRGGLDPLTQKYFLFSAYQYVQDIQTKLPTMSEDLQDKIDDLPQWSISTHHSYFSYTNLVYYRAGELN